MSHSDDHDITDFVFTDEDIEDLLQEGIIESNNVGIWSGTVQASYTGLTTIEQVTKYAVNVIAKDEAGATQIVRNLYYSILNAKYPILNYIIVKFVRKYKPLVDKDKIPHLVDESLDWLGSFRKP